MTVAFTRTFIIISLRIRIHVNMILTEVKIEGLGVLHRGDVTLCRPNLSVLFFFFGTTPELVLSRPVFDYFLFHCLRCQGCSCSAVRCLVKSVRSRAAPLRRQQRFSSRGLRAGPVSTRSLEFPYDIPLHGMKRHRSLIPME